MIEMDLENEMFKTRRASLTENNCLGIEVCGQTYTFGLFHYFSFVQVL